MGCLHPLETTLNIDTCTHRLTQGDLCWPNFVGQTRPMLQGFHSLDQVFGKVLGISGRNPAHILYMYGQFCSRFPPLCDVCKAAMSQLFQEENISCCMVTGGKNWIRWIHLQSANAQIISVPGRLPYRMFHWKPGCPAPLSDDKMPLSSHLAHVCSSSSYQTEINLNQIPSSKPPPNWVELIRWSGLPLGPSLLKQPQGSFKKPQAFGKFCSRSWCFLVPSMLVKGKQQQQNHKTVLSNSTVAPEWSATVIFVLSDSQQKSTGYPLVSFLHMPSPTRTVERLQYLPCSYTTPVAPNSGNTPRK